MHNTKEIENINKILVANNAFVKNKIDSSRQSQANLTNESVTDGEDNASNHFYKINTYSSSFDTKLKGPSSMSSVTRDRFMDFEEMSVGEAMPSGKREGQQQSFHQTYQFILGTPKYRNNSCTNNSNNGGSKVSLISSKKSEVSGSDEDTTKIFLQQLRILQNKVNQQENQMKNMDQKCEEVKKENNELKKNLDKITKDNEEKKFAEKDQEIQKLQTKNTQLQEQLEKVKENYENRISDYQNLIDDLNQQLLDKENQVEETKRQLAGLQKKMNQSKDQNLQLIEKVKNLEDLIEKQVDDNSNMDENQKTMNNHKLSQQSSMNYQLYEKSDFSNNQGKSATSIYTSIQPKRQINHQQSLQQQNQQSTSSNDRNSEQQSLGQSMQQQQFMQSVSNNKNGNNTIKLDDQQTAFQQQILVNQQFLQSQVNQQQQLMMQQQQKLEETQYLQQALKNIQNKGQDEEESKMKKERSRSQQSSRCRSPWGDTLKFEILSNNNFSEFNQTKNELDMEDDFCADQNNKFNPSSTFKSIGMINNSIQKSKHNTSLKYDEGADNSLSNSNNKVYQQSLNQNNSGGLNISKFRKNSRNSKQMAMVLINQQQQQQQQQQTPLQQQNQSIQYQKLIQNNRLNQTIDQVRCRSEQRNIISPLHTHQTLQHQSNNDQLISPISGKLINTNKTSKRGGGNITVDLRLTLNNQNLAAQTLDNSLINSTNHNNSLNQTNTNNSFIQTNTNNSLNQTNTNSSFSQINQFNNVPINPQNGLNPHQIPNSTINNRNLINKPPSRSRSRQEELNNTLQYQNQHNTSFQGSQPIQNNMSISSTSKNKYQQYQHFFQKDQQNSGSLNHYQTKGKGYRIKNDSPSPLSQKKSEFRSIDHEPNSQSASRKHVTSQQSNYTQKSNLNNTIQVPSRSPQSSQPQSTSHKRQTSSHKNQKMNLTLNSNYLNSNSQTPNNANTSSNSTKSKKSAIKGKIQKYQSLNADDYTNNDIILNNKQKFQTITPSSQSSNGCSTAHTNSSNNVQYQAQLLQQLQQQQNYFTSIDSKGYQLNNSNSNNMSDAQKIIPIQNQRSSNNRSPLQKRIKSTNSPSISFYDGSKQNIMNKTMNYVDVTNYLENHGLQQQLDENYSMGIHSAKNSTNTTTPINLNPQINSNFTGGNILRQSAQLQNIQNLANLNSAHLRSRSEQAQYNQKKQQILLQQQINDQLNQNNNKKKQLQLLSNDESQNRTPSNLYDNQNFKNFGMSTNKNQQMKQHQQQNLNLNFLNNYEIIEQTFESQTSSSIKSRSKNKNNQ